jgi:hypothetical protein
MQNERVFTANTDVDAHTQDSTGLSYRRHDTGKAAAGGIDVMDTSEEEASPLLGRARFPVNRQSEDSGAVQDTEEDTWIGDGEFAQRPWWNKPSVSEHVVLGMFSAECRPIGLLVTASVFALYPCDWRFSCPKNQLDSRFDLQRVFLRATESHPWRSIDARYPQ